MNKISVNMVLPVFGFEAFIKSRPNFTLYHLLAAETAAIAATDIEGRYKSEKPPQKEIDLCLSHVSIAIICSVAALESNINEFIIDHEKPLSVECPNLIPALLKKYRKLKKDNIIGQFDNTTDVLLKYDTVLSMLKNRLITHPHTTLVQDIEYIVVLRNALVHFTPEWHGDLIRHAKINKTRNNRRFPTSPFHNSKEFPYFLSAACATTSTTRAKEFIELFKSYS